MNKKVKIWLIAAASLILVGIVIFIGAMTVLGWDFSLLSTSSFETNDYTITEGYKDISITTDTAAIVFKPSEDRNALVICYEQENSRHSVFVENGTLMIQVHNTKKWYEYIGINFDSPQITVYLPTGEHGALTVNASTGSVQIPNNFKFDSINIGASTGAVICEAGASGDIKIRTSTGSILVAGISAKNLDLSVSTGGVTVSSVACDDDVLVKVSTGRAALTGVTCQNLTSTGDTGGIILNKVIANGKLSIERSTGRVKLFDSDAGEIFIKTDTGDVSATLLTPKIVSAQTDTGKINVPKSTEGGLCEIITDTGDIRVSVSGE